MKKMKKNEKMKKVGKRETAMKPRREDKEKDSEERGKNERWKAREGGREAGREGGREVRERREGPRER